MALQRGMLVVWQLAVSALLIVISLVSPAVASAQAQTGWFQRCCEANWND